MFKNTKNIIPHIFFLFLFILFAENISAQDKLLDILKDEMSREMSEFAKNADSSDMPYFISFRVDETKSETVQTSFGSLMYSQIGRASCRERV